MVSPGSDGNFHRAIMQSGYASTRWPTLADGEALGHDTPRTWAAPIRRGC